MERNHLRAAPKSILLRATNKWLQDCGPARQQVLRPTQDQLDKEVIAGVAVGAAKATGTFREGTENKKQPELEEKLSRVGLAIQLPIEGNEIYLAK